jgi:hypothetical protein
LFVLLQRSHLLCFNVVERKHFFILPKKEKKINLLRTQISFPEISPEGCRKRKVLSLNLRILKFNDKKIKKKL